MSKNQTKSLSACEWRKPNHCDRNYERWMHTMNCATPWRALPFDRFSACIVSPRVPNEPPSRAVGDAAILRICIDITVCVFMNENKLMNRFQIKNNSKVLYKAKSLYSFLLTVNRTDFCFTGAIGFNADLVLVNTSMKTIIIFDEKTKTMIWPRSISSRSIPNYLALYELILNPRHPEFHKTFTNLESLNRDQSGINKIHRNQTRPSDMWHGSHAPNWSATWLECAQLIQYVTWITSN